MPFSTGTGLERMEIAGPVLESSLSRSAGSGYCAPLQKQERKRINGGSPIAAPMPKLVLFCGEKRSTVWRANVLRTFHRWGGLVFIVYVFPNWMVIRIFSH